MKACEIRAATPADADAVAEYHDRCFRNTYSSQLLAGEFEAPDLAGTRQQLHEWFLSESGLETQVAVLDGAPIGHVTVSGHQLVHLFVEPDHQHFGLGSHLLALGEAMRYMRKHWKEFTLFLRKAGAPLDNNITEQSLKRAILHRKNALFYKTDQGAQVGDTFMSLIQTCALAQVNPFDYLTALQNNAAAVADNPAQWLPWNYRERGAGLSP
jgi:GNAT superfamily N-acetyltransferase